MNKGTKIILVVIVILTILYFVLKNKQKTAPETTFKSMFADFLTAVKNKIG